MTWFKVDDGFYSHPKVLSIPRTIRAEALGTWALCGTWSCDKLTDGRIPIHMVEELGGTIEGAEALAAVRLWKRDKTAYTFVNWSEWQYTREQVETNREHERKRKAAARAAKGGDRHDPAATSGDVPAGQVPDTSRTNAVSELPVPSRPGPYPPDSSSMRPSSSKTEDEAVDNSDGLDACATRYGFDGDRVRTELAKVLRGIPEDDDVIRVATAILGRAAKWPDEPTAFLVGAMRKHPHEAAQLAYGGAA